MTLTRRAFGVTALTAAVATTLAACGTNSTSESGSDSADGGLTLLTAPAGPR